MADDAMAAVYANLSLRLLIWLRAGMDRVSAEAPPLGTAEIIAVGSELLGSSRIDTNSLFLAGRLAVARDRAAGEERSSATTGRGSRRVSRGALSRADLVILTGGLGPDRRRPDA